MLKEYIKSKEAEFDREFLTEPSDETKSGKRLICDPEFAKNFLISSLTGLLDEIEKEVSGMKQELPKSPCRNAENHMFGRCFDCEKIKGFNQALEEVAALLKKERGDVTNNYGN